MYYYLKPLLKHFVLFITIVVLPLTAAAEYACEPSPTSFLGTHYKDIAKANAQLGKGFHMRGTVFSATDCRPIAGARVEHWQAGENGLYQDRFYAYQITSAKGRFSFETEYPGTTPAHVHFIITAPGYKRLVTQWVSKGFRDQVTLYLTLEPAQ